MRALYVLPIVGTVCLIGFVANVVTGSLTLGDSIIQWTIGVLSLSAFLFARRELRLREEEIREGADPITYATRLHVYETVLSFLIVTVRLPSRYVIAGSDAPLRLGCTAFSLAFGWWGIPWGPLWTGKAIVGNLRNGKNHRWRAPGR